MKQVGNLQNFRREIAKETAVERTKQGKGHHAFSYQADDNPEVGRPESPREWVEATDVGPGILTRGLPKKETDPK